MLHPKFVLTFVASITQSRGNHYMKLGEILTEKLQGEAPQVSAEFAEVGLNLKIVATTSVEERIDVVWSKFNPSTAEEFQSLIVVFKAFGVHFINKSDQQFLYKLYVIERFIEVHGFDNVFDVNAKIDVLRGLYSSLGAELSSLTLENLELLQNFSALMSSADISKVQCGKLTFIFKELAIDKLSKWKAHTLENLIFVLNEFGIDLSRITNLELASRASDIKDLGLWSESLVAIQGRIEFIKGIKDNLASLNPLEVSKIKALFQALNFNEIEPSALSWFTSKVDFGFKNLNETTFASVRAAQTKLQTITTKALKDISEADIDKAEALLAALGEQVLTITTEKVQTIVKAIPFQSIVDVSISADLIDVLKTFKLDIMKGDTEFKNTRMFLASFGIELLSLSSYEARSLALTTQSFGGLKSKAILTDTISTFGYKSLLEIDETELSKLGLMAKIVGVKKVPNLEGYNLKHMKIISNSLNFNIPEVAESDLQHLQSLLDKLKFQDTAKEQGWFSYLTQGEEAALQSKLDEIKHKSLALGFENIFAFDYDKVESCLAHFGKSFTTVATAELSKFTKSLQIFGFDLHDGYSYQINSAIALFKTFHANPFALSAIELANLKALLADSSISSFDSSDMQFMKQVLDNYSIRIPENCSDKLQELKSNLSKLGLSLVFDAESREIMTQIMKVTGPSLEKLALIVEFAEDFKTNSEAVLGYVSLFDVKSKELMTETHHTCIDFAQPLDEGVKARITSAVKALEPSCTNDEDECAMPVIGDLVKQICDTN